MPALALEIATYEDQLPHLLAESAERYVLIKGHEIHGVFAERDQAIDRGFAMFPGENFLVRKIQAKPRARWYPRPLSPG